MEENLPNDRNRWRKEDRIQKGGQPTPEVLKNETDQGVESLPRKKKDKGLRGCKEGEFAFCEQGGG